MSQPKSRQREVLEYLFHQTVTRVNRDANHGVRGLSIVVNKFYPELLSSLPFTQLASQLHYFSVIFHEILFGDQLYFSLSIF